MELQKLITTNNDYIDIFKKNKIKVNTYKNLAICKYENKDNLTEEWMTYCRGCIIDTSTDKLVCVPPKKSLDIDMEYNISVQKDIILQNLIEGTMINLFYTDQWTLSTRSSIGANNKWKSYKSFKNMFYESGGLEIDYDRLNQNCTYSFVLLHQFNQNISVIHTNRLVLVDIFNLDTMEYETNLQTYENSTGFTVIQNIPIHISINDYIQNLENIDFHWKGFTVKYGGKRYKYINPNYEKALTVLGNETNLISRVCRLYNQGLIHTYIYYFPVDMNKIRSIQNVMYGYIYKLYNSYKELFITKTITKDNIDFELKPCVFELHNIYKQTKQKITYKKTVEYFKNLHPKRIYFIIFKKCKSIL